MKKLFSSIVMVLFLLSSFSTISSGELILEVENQILDANNEIDIEMLNVGDFLFCDINLEVLTYAWEVNSGNSNDHCAMYIGNNKFIHAVPSLPKVNLPSGVCIWQYSEFERFFTDIVFARVINTTNKERYAAVNWAFDRLGNHYQYKHYIPGANYDPFDSEDDYSNKWYCSELLWAAYYNTSNSQIDLCYYNWTRGQRVFINHILGDYECETYTNIPPNANVNIRLYRYPENYKIVHFNTWDARDPDGIRPEYQWDFENDGIWDTPWMTYNWSGVDHEYNSYGTYSVRFRVRDNKGATDEITKEFTIQEKKSILNSYQNTLDILYPLFTLLSRFCIN